MCWRGGGGGGGGIVISTCTLTSAFIEEALLGFIILLLSTGFYATGNSKFNSIVFTHSCVQHSAQAFKL